MEPGAGTINFTGISTEMTLKAMGTGNKRTKNIPIQALDIQHLKGRKRMKQCKLK